MSERNDVDALVKSMKSAASPCRIVLRELHERYRAEEDGAVANYIPELATADPQWFGIAIATVDGQVFEIGDTKQPFTIQSISKPFVYGMALEDHGREHVLGKVGVEPTGEAFNSIILDQTSNRPFNPMVNAGAIAVADLVQGADLTDRTKRLLAMFERYLGREAHVNTPVFLSERATGHRNRAMAHLMRGFGMVSDRVDEALELYFQQCSVEVTCRDLAVMGATLANGGTNPMTGVRALREEYIRDLLNIMYTCGMYDFAGEWSSRVGLPAKSGVSGGIVAVVPGEMGIGVFSPRVDAKGNSVRGVKTCLEMSERFGLHGFASAVSRKPFLEQLKRLGERAPAR